MLILPSFIAHRGDKTYAPENTLIAFSQAHKKGATWIEADATLTRDIEKPCVMFHDDTLGRTTDQPDTPIAETPYAVVRAADAGKWYSPAFRDERVPTLLETLELCDKLKLNINIEIKVSAKKGDNTPEPYDSALARCVARRVVEDVQKAQPQNCQILLSSFSTEALLEAKKLAPTLAYGYLLHQMWTKDSYEAEMPCFAEKLAQINPDVVTLNQALLTSKMRVFAFSSIMERTLGRKVPLLAYTVNDPDRAKQLFSWGVQSLFTDCVGDLQQSLNSSSLDHFPAL